MSLICNERLVFKIQIFFNNVRMLLDLICYFSKIFPDHKMICCCCSRGGRFVLNSCCDNGTSSQERIGLLSEELDRENRKEKRQVICSTIPEFPTFVIDLILEFEESQKKKHGLDWSIFLMCESKV